MAANRYRGQTFGVPQFIDAGLLYYRKDLLEKYRLGTPRTGRSSSSTPKRFSARARSTTGRLLGTIQAVRGSGLQHDGTILGNGGALWNEELKTSALQSDRAKAGRSCAIASSARSRSAALLARRAGSSRYSSRADNFHRSGLTPGKYQ
jgi:maltose-binding protein MalE